jgi:hypothetical protein
MRLGDSVAARISRAFGYRFQLSPLAGVGLLVAGACLLLWWVFDGVLFGRSTAMGGSSAGSIVSQAYFAGFQDAEKGNPFGTSMPEPSGAYEGHQEEAGGSGGFGISNMFTIFILGRTVYSLGQGPAGGWSPANVIQNAQRMQGMQLFFFGLMLLRLFGLSPI